MNDDELPGYDSNFAAAVEELIAAAVVEKLIAAVGELLEILPTFDPDELAAFFRRLDARRSR